MSMIAAAVRQRRVALVPDGYSIDLGNYADTFDGAVEFDGLRTAQADYSGVGYSEVLAAGGSGVGVMGVRGIPTTGQAQQVWLRVYAVNGGTFYSQSDQDVSTRFAVTFFDSNNDTGQWVWKKFGQMNAGDARLSVLADAAQIGGLADCGYIHPVNSLYVPYGQDGEGGNAPNLTAGPIAGGGGGGGGGGGHAGTGRTDGGATITEVVNPNSGNGFTVARYSSTQGEAIWSDPVSTSASHDVFIDGTRVATATSANSFFPVNVANPGDVVRVAICRVNGSAYSLPWIAEGPMVTGQGAIQGALGSWDDV